MTRPESLAAWFNAHPEVEDGPEYVYECIKAPGCRGEDTHAIACEHYNDEARRDFYEDLIADETIAEATRQGFAADEVAVWIDEVLK